MLGDAISDRIPIIVFDLKKLPDNGAIIPTNDRLQHFFTLFMPTQNDRSTVQQFQITLSL
jgi:hypothetical protein